jgi:ketosteroid isomerase-like protein
MAGQTPLETVRQLVDAINGGHVQNALSLYESQGVMVSEPGRLAVGTDALRNALAGFIALKPTLRIQSHQLIETGDIALYCSSWHLSGTGPDGSAVEMDGKSSDVLRRQGDGRWLIAIDNPWGTGILG